MSVALSKNIGAYLVGRFAMIPNVITAAAGNDGVEVDGPYIDLEGFVAGPPLSCKVLVVWSATLVATETLTLTANVQDATDTGGTAVADYENGTGQTGFLAATVVATGPTGDGTVTGVTAFDVNLDYARNALRLQLTADLSASGTDTVALAAVIAFGGLKALPAS